MSPFHEILKIVERLFEFWRQNWPICLRAQLARSNSKLSYLTNQKKFRQNGVLQLLLNEKIVIAELSNTFIAYQI